MNVIVPPFIVQSFSSKKEMVLYFREKFNVDAYTVWDERA